MLLDKLTHRVKVNNIHTLIFATVCVLFGIFAVWGIGAFDVVNGFLGNAQKITVSDSEENISGKYVELETPYLFDYFWHFDGKFLKWGSRYYTSVVFTEENGTPKLMAVEIPSYKFDLADRISASTFNGEESAETLKIRGHIRRMSKDKYAHFQEDYAELGVETMPYVIIDESLDYGYVIFAFLFFAGAVFFLIMQIIDMRKCLDIDRIREEFDSDNGYGAFDMALEECEHGDVTENDIYIGKNYIVFAEGTVRVMKLEDIVWVYGYVQKQNFITTVSCIKLNDKYGKTYIKAAKQRDFDVICHKLENHNPAIICGHSVELERLYKNDRDGFVRMSEEKNVTEKI